MQAPAASPLIRQRLEIERAQVGDILMHARLREVDPDIAERLNPNDWVRVQRALEVYELTGNRLSVLHRAHKMQQPRYRARFIGIRWEPSELEARIRMRASLWLANGWIEEVERLLSEGYRETRPMMSVGYRQIVEFLDGVGGGEAALLERITRATKVFARRQRTWLRDERVDWVGPLVDGVGG